VSGDDGKDRPKGRGKMSKAKNRKRPSGPVPVDMDAVEAAEEAKAAQLVEERGDLAAFPGSPLNQEELVHDVLGEVQADNARLLLVAFLDHNGELQYGFCGRTEGYYEKLGMLDAIRYGLHRDAEDEHAEE